MKYKSRIHTITAVTFNELVEYGRKSGTPIVNGMPWSFTYEGFNITHENDQCYLVPSLSGHYKMSPNDVLIVGSHYIPFVCSKKWFDENYQPL